MQLTPLEFDALSSNESPTESSLNNDPLNLSFLSQASSDNQAMTMTNSALTMTMDPLLNGIYLSAGVIIKVLLEYVSVCSSTREAQSILEAIYKTHIINSIVDGLHTYALHLNEKTMARLLHVLSELVLTSSKFMAQFMDSKGLQTLDELPISIFTGCCRIIRSNPTDGPTDMTKDSHHILTIQSTTTKVTTTNSYTNINRISHDKLNPEHYRTEVLACSLQLASHLIRNTEKYMNILITIFTTKKLICLLLQSNRMVRAKCCNLIGNLCRHSNRFYQILGQQYTITMNEMMTSFYVEYDDQFQAKKETR
jgi:hypothetical protein